MQEQLIDLQTAILAKEKGFNIPVYSYYSGNDLHKNYSIINQYSLEYIEDKGECLIINYSGGGSLDLETINFNSWGDNNFSAPTQSLLQKWLRETKGIIVEVYLIDSHSYGKMYGCLINYNSKTTRVNDKHKYEDALETGLFEALKLI